MDRVDEPDARGAEAAATPNLIIEALSGPLDFLLRLSRAHQINLGVLPLQAIVEQLAVALEHAPVRMPLGQKADWVVMTSWILLLRSDLMLPQEKRGQKEAQTEAGQLRDRLMALQGMRALRAGSNAGLNSAAMCSRVARRNCRPIR